MAAAQSARRESADAPLEALLREVRARREDFSKDQQISADVIDMMRSAGVYRAMVAKRFGGDEKSPAEFLRLIEQISEADGSAGWVASFGFSAVYLSSLPLQTLEVIYANGPDVVFAGGIFPPQKAVQVDGGVEVSGRWSWGSGCTGADIVGVGIKVGDQSGGGLPLIAVMPAGKVSIARNWDVIGLKGTGSHDMVVDKVVVPQDWTFIRGGASTLDTPLYRYPSLPLAAQVLAVVGMGVARAALDELTALAGGRGSITGAPVLAQRPNVQIDLAKAEAALRSARAFFYDVTEEAFRSLEADDDLSVEAKAMLRLASTHAARVGADVAQAVYRLGGTTGVSARHPIARHMQDAMIVPQHAFLADATWAEAGRILLGLEPGASFP